MANKRLKMTCDVNVIFKNNKTCVNNLLYVYILKIRVYFAFINAFNFLTHFGLL